MGEFKLGFFFGLVVVPRRCVEEGGHYVCFCALGEFIFGQLGVVLWTLNVLPDDL
jgi:hypothetical protein